MKKSFFLLRVGLLAALLLTLGIGFTANAQGDTVLVIGWEQEPDRPVPSSSSAFAAYLAGLYGRDIWDWDAERNIFPIMVEEIPTFENGLVTTVPVTGDFDGDGTEEAGEAPVVTYRLRPNMRWSDSEAITAEDCMVYHNLMMQENPLDSVQRNFYPIVVESAEVVDELTFRLTYNTPWPDFLTNAPISCTLPAHVINPLMDTDGDGVFEGNFDETPFSQDFLAQVGYGPYIITEYNVGQDMRLELNPYWGENEWETVPTITEIIAQFILEPQQMENALRVGDIDIAFNMTTAGAYADMDDVAVWSMLGVFNDALWMNSGPESHPAMQDVLVREAIVHAIDRRTLTEELIGGGAGDSIPRSWFPEQFVPDDLPFREFDVDLANTLLDESGWVDSNSNGTRDKDGIELVLRFFTTAVIPRQDYQVFIQNYLQDVGIRTQLFIVNGPTILFAPFADRGVLNTGQYDLAIYGLSNNPLSPNGSPTNFHCGGIPSTENPSGRNSTWFCNEEYDRLDTLVSITNDPTERAALHTQLEPLFYEAAIWHGLYIRRTFYAARTDRWDVDSMMLLGTLSSNYFNQIEFWQPLE
jgi:peptide/nickel transport system substrate-binding protein